MSKTSNTEFYSLSLNSLSPPPLPTYESVIKQDEKNGTINERDFRKGFVRRLTPPFLRTHSTENGDDSSRSKKKATWTRNLADLIVNWWLWELCSWVMSALCIFAIALLLCYYNGRAVPDRWPLGITLNTYISVLSGIAKYTLAVPVDEALGQLKWHWFARAPRPLLDFERFDDASRGPFGALALLLYTKGRSLASLGAIITIFSLTLDPFFQQLVSLPKRPTTYGQSAVPRLVDFTIQRSIYNNGTEGVDFSAPDRIMQDAVFSYMVNNGTDHEVSAFCPSQDCAWDPFDTLAMCSQCTDVAPMLEFACLEESGEWRSEVTVNDVNSTKVVSCGHFLNATSDNPILMSGYSLNSSASDGVGELLLMRNLNLQDVNVDVTYWGGSINYGNPAFPIVDFIQIAAQDAASVFRNETPTARECVVQWCTKRIVASYDQGNYSEHVISEAYDTTEPFDALDFGTDMVFTYYKNISITPPGSSLTFIVPNATALPTIFLFQDYMPAYLTGKNATATPLLRTHNWVGEDPKLWTYPNNPFAEPHDGTAYLQNMTTAVTNVIRSYPGSSEMFRGTGGLETYIRARWGFFALPLLLVCFTLVLLIAVIIDHRKAGDMGIWKTSSLATLANGLDPSIMRTFGSTRQMYDVFENSAKVKVALRPERDKYKLSIVGV